MASGTTNSLCVGYFVVVVFAVGIQSGCAGTTNAGLGSSSEAQSGATAPAITSLSASDVAIMGQTATFTVSATGTAPLGYQWRRNGVDIPGATSSSYTTPATTTADDGAQFSVAVSNSAGSATSSAATLTVNTPVSITSQPVGQTVIAGQSAAFAVTAAGTGPLSYQWSQNGANISGATAASYAIPATTTADTGAQFTVVVTNAVGNATSTAATLTVNAATLLLSANPSSLSFGSVNVSSNQMLSVTISNTGNSSVTIASVSQSGPSFSVSGVSTGLMLLPEQTAPLNVTFTPWATGNLTGSVAVYSNAPNSPAMISLSGVGSVPHPVTLSWTASTDTVFAYNIQRGTVPGGPYEKIYSLFNGIPSFTDTTVRTGQTYYYVVTSVSFCGVDSEFSNEVSAVIPTP
jgi:Abnormal spindle-like microcephaly-assoc'd, ASPM-SPD-2-Hydin